MLKVCAPSIYKLLEIILNQCLETSVFRLNVKRVTLFLFTKKGQANIEKQPSIIVA